MAAPTRPEDRLLAENFKTGLTAAASLASLTIVTSNEANAATVRSLPLLGISVKRTGDSLIIRDPNRGAASEFELNFELRVAYPATSSATDAETLAGSIKTAVNTISSTYFTTNWTVVDALVWTAVEREFEEAVRIIRLTATCIGIFKI
jgi:hypothetical protein